MADANVMGSSSTPAKLGLNSLPGNTRLHQWRQRHHRRDALGEMKDGRAKKRQ